MTWPRHVGQAPIFFSQRPSGRPAKRGVRYSSSYLDLPSTPQFSFGHGQSYSRFILNDLRCNPSCVKTGESVEVSVTIHNDSLVDGEATLFLFAHDVVASIARPVLELKGVRKVALAAGERGRAIWRVPTETLAFIGPSFDPILEPGRVEIHVGQNADPVDFLTHDIELTA